MIALHDHKMLQQAQHKQFTKLVLRNLQAPEYNFTLTEINLKICVKKTITDCFERSIKKSAYLQIFPIYKNVSKMN